MVELCILSSPFFLTILIAAWIHDRRSRKRGPWSMCGVSGGCSCSLKKVCAKDDCQCGRPKVCIDHACMCRLPKACSDLECRCGRPKVCLEHHLTEEPVTK